MSVQGLCQVCGVATAEYQCPRCGSLVCPTHHDAESGLCSTCATEVGRARSGGSS